VYEWVKLENLRIAREKRAVVELVKLSIEENHLPIWRLPDEVALTPLQRSVAWPRSSAPSAALHGLLSDRESRERGFLICEIRAMLESPVAAEKRLATLFHAFGRRLVKL
jgi:hypothetical protein